MIGLLLLASLVSAALGEMADAVAIACIINGLVGFFREYRTERAMAAALVVPIPLLPLHILWINLVTLVLMRQTERMRTVLIQEFFTRSHFDPDRHQRHAADMSARRAGCLAEMERGNALIRVARGLMH